ncbi:hypothetical protein SISNIDRAFT_548497, partial [Sistotremastrum niveocremeum HHB9708]
MSLITLPTELIDPTGITVGLLLSDLYSLALSCERFYHFAKESRRYWMGAPDKDALALPTGHTIESVNLALLMPLAARALNIYKSGNTSPMTPKRHVSYGTEDGTLGSLNTVRILLGHSWYIEYKLRGLRIRRAEEGWGEIHCDLDLPTFASDPFAAVLGEGVVRLSFQTAKSDKSAHRILNILRLKFPDENGPPSAPTILDWGRFEFPSVPGIVKIAGDLVLTSVRESLFVQLLDQKRNHGIKLTFSRLVLEEMHSIWFLMLNLNLHKMLIGTTSVSRTDALRYTSRYHLVDVPWLNDLESTNSVGNAETTWETREMAVLDALAFPCSSHSNSVLPSDGAVCIARSVSKPLSESKGSIYVHENKLFWIDASDLQAVPANQIPPCGVTWASEKWYEPGEIFHLRPLLPSRRAARAWNYALPNDIEGMVRYRVLGVDRMRGRMFIKVEKRAVCSNFNMTVMQEASLPSSKNCEGVHGSESPEF